LSRKQTKWIAVLCGFSLLTALPLTLIVRQHNLRAALQQERDAALIQAIYAQDLSGVVSALDQGADPNPQGRYKKDLDRPSWGRMLTIMTGSKTRPNTRSALNLALGNPLNNANEIIPPENEEIIRALLDRGADPNCPNEDDFPPLLSAASSAKYKIA